VAIGVERAVVVWKSCVLSHRGRSGVEAGRKQGANGEERYGSGS
jgi:hypothetical protein